MPVPPQSRGNCVSHTGHNVGMFITMAGNPGRVSYTQISLLFSCIDTVCLLFCTMSAVQLSAIVSRTKHFRLRFHQEKSLLYRTNNCICMHNLKLCSPGLNVEQTKFTLLFHLKSHTTNRKVAEYFIEDIAQITCK